MSSRALLIDIPVQHRPAYNNTHVGSYARWRLDNRDTLLGWWFQCDVAVRVQGGCPAVDQLEDFEQFCKAQHDREAHT